jgi:hypothetical protein
MEQYMLNQHFISAQTLSITQLCSCHCWLGAPWFGAALLLTDRYVHVPFYIYTCRAALVLASAAQFLADLLEAKGDGEHQVQHPKHVARSAIYEARYAVKFLEQSLFTGKAGLPTWHAVITVYATSVIST